MKHTRLLLILMLLVLLLALPTTASAQIPDPEEWAEDLAQDFAFAIDGLWYDLLRLHAQAQWFLMRIFLIAGLIIDLVADFISTQAFAPLITQSSNQFGVAVSLSFTIAMIVLGLSYMVAHFIRLQVVELRSALVWFAVTGLFFQLGPELYLGLNNLRSDINSFFYATSLDTLNNTGSPLAPLNNNLASDDIPMHTPCDNLGWMLGQSSNQPGQGVDGHDIAMAYLLATAHDVLGQAPPILTNCTTVNPGTYEKNLPFWWYHTDGYFDITLEPVSWDFIPAAEQRRSLDLASAAQYRLFGAWPLLWLGIFEKMVYLLITFAQGLSFVSFAVAAIFAFFKRTEAIARSVVDLWIEIIVTSIVIALGQSLMVSLALAAAATQNPLATIGVSILCMMLMLILLLSGVKLVWNASTRIFSALGQATSGAFVTPQQAATGVAVGAVGTVAAVATGGGALALAGAAMSGMNASGIGGSGMSMASNQLMSASRMMTGVRRARSGNRRPQASAPQMPDNITPRVPEMPTTPASDSANIPNYAVQVGKTSGQFTPLADQQVLLNQDSLRDTATAQAQLNADNTRDDAALRSALHSQERSANSNGLEQAARDLQAAAQTLGQSQIAGHLDISGRRNVGAVVADAIDLGRENHNGQVPFSERLTQAVGMQPTAGQSPVSDVARFNAVGNQAQQLGLSGNQVLHVLREQAQAPDGRSIQPNTQQQLVQVVQANTGLRQPDASQQVAQFLTLAAALPSQLRVTGSLPAEHLYKGNNDDNAR